MKIEIQLTEHCIEHTLKLFYDKLMSECFSSSDQLDSTLEAKIELLEKFINSVNFSQLRADYPELSGNNKITVINEERDAVFSKIGNDINQHVSTYTVPIVFSDREPDKETYKGNGSGILVRIKNKYFILFAIIKHESIDTAMTE